MIQIHFTGFPTAGESARNEARGLGGITYDKMLLD